MAEILESIKYKNKKKGLTAREQYLVTKMNWWNKNTYEDVPEQRSAYALREMIKRRHDDYDWTPIEMLVKKLREPITSGNVDRLIGSILWWGPKDERTYMHKWASKKAILLQLAFAESEIEGKSDTEVKRMLLLETL
jgi:hypothetical protein